VSLIPYNPPTLLVQEAHGVVALGLRKRKKKVFDQRSAGVYSRLFTMHRAKRRYLHSSY
jgi:hypothetical protein